MKPDEFNAPMRSSVDEAVPRPTRGPSRTPTRPRGALPDAERRAFFSGHARLPGRLASAPGPIVTLVVGLACLVLGLSVVWMGDASETAAGFWPPAGAALVALMIVPARRWGWVFIGIVVPTATGFVLGLMPTSAAVWWAAGNRVEPALAAVAIRSFIASRWSTTGRALAFFAGVAVIAAPMVGGAIGGIGTVVGYHERWGDVRLKWGLGDGLGVLVIASLVLSYAPRASTHRTKRERLALEFLVVPRSCDHDAGVRTACRAGSDGARYLACRYDHHAVAHSNSWSHQNERRAVDLRRVRAVL